MIDDQPDSAGRGGRAGPGYAGRRERREQTRTALLDAAERMWAERGIRGASLTDIAAAAGMTKGAVYSNFTGKTDLLLALLDRGARGGTGAGLRAELLGTGNGAGAALEDRLQRAGRKYAERLGTPEARLLELLTVELWLYGMRDYAAGWRVAESYDARRAHLAGGLADVGGISAVDRATLAMAVDLGLTLQHLLDPDRVPAELYTRAMRLVLGPALS
jgi:AcrR family transcriptional regulator